MVTPQALWELERSLNSPKFFDIEMGATINDILIIKLLLANSANDFKSRLVNYLKYFAYPYYQRKAQWIDYGRYKGRKVFVSASNRPDLWNFIYSIVLKYKREDVLVICPNASKISGLAEKYECISLADLGSIDMAAWRQEFSRCFPQWREKIFEIFRKHSIPERFSLDILLGLMFQSRQIMASLKFIEQIEPTVIVTDYDRHQYASCLILAAKQSGVPSVTMVHGALEPYPSYGFAPLVADYACCWGEMHRDNLREHGVKDDALVITGCQNIEEHSNVARSTGLEKHRLDSEKPVVVLATCPLKSEVKLKVALVFCEALSQMTEFQAFVRLHPSERLSEYQDVIDGFSSIQFFPTSHATKDECLAAADIVVSHESSFGLDAIIRAKPVIALKIDEMHFKIGRQLHEGAGCPIVSNADDLKQLVVDIHENQTVCRRILAIERVYAKKYCFSYGETATDNICGLINQIARA